MTGYGILVVDTGWTNQNSVQIEKTTHLRHKDHLIEGAQALIYVRHPVDAIVAQAELTGQVIQMETEPEAAALDPAVSESAGSDHEPEPGAAIPLNQALEKTFLLPLKLVRLKGQTEPIHINQLQIILGSDFTVFDETWIPLNEAQYEAILALWEK